VLFQDRFFGSPKQGNPGSQGDLDTVFPPLLFYLFTKEGCMGTLQQVNGSAPCPQCRGTSYIYRQPHFLCTSCGLLVDGVGQPVPKPLSCSKPHFFDTHAESGSSSVEQTGVATNADEVLGF
jgi:hypothetical protein